MPLAGLRGVHTLWRLCNAYSVETGNALDGGETGLEFERENADEYMERLLCKWGVKWEKILKNEGLK